MRLFFGGTFNPIHIGHVRVALECHWKTGAALTSFVPSRMPPHKPGLAPLADHRLRMVEAVVAELNGQQGNGGAFQVETCELTREGPSYTVDTLAHLRQQSPRETLVWVVGMDSFINLTSWHRWESLTDHASLLVINRPGVDPQWAPALQDWLAPRRCNPDAIPAQGGVAFMATTALAISSSVLRQQIHQGLSPAYLVTESVRRYLEKYRLYQSSETTEL